MCLGGGGGRGGGGGGGSADQARAEAERKAADDARKVREENERQMAAMQAKLDKMEKARQYTPAPSRVGSTLGAASRGVSKAPQYAKRSRAKKASDLRIQLNPAASATQGGQGAGQVNP